MYRVAHIKCVCAYIPYNAGSYLLLVLVSLESVCMASNYYYKLYLDNVGEVCVLLLAVIVIVSVQLPLTNNFFDNRAQEKIIELVDSIVGMTQVLHRCNTLQTKYLKFQTF